VAAVFAGSVAVCFGASALYHRVTWTPRARMWMRRVDHAGVYLLIAGTNTPVSLLVLHGAWRPVVFAIVWVGAAAAMIVKFVWVAAPKWLAAAIGIALGWVGSPIQPAGLSTLAVVPIRRRLFSVTTNSFTLSRSWLSLANTWRLRFSSSGLTKWPKASARHWS
jgi:hemolysin III